MSDQPSLLGALRGRKGTISNQRELSGCVEGYLKAGVQGCCSPTTCPRRAQVPARRGCFGNMTPEPHAAAPSRGSRQVAVCFSLEKGLGPGKWCSNTGLCSGWELVSLP